MADAIDEVLKRLVEAGGYDTTGLNGAGDVVTLLQNPRDEQGINRNKLVTYFSGTELVCMFVLPKRQGIIYVDPPQTVVPFLNELWTSIQTGRARFFPMRSRLNQD